MKNSRNAFRYYYISKSLSCGNIHSFSSPYTMATAVKHRKQAFMLITSANWRGGWSHERWNSRAALARLADARPLHLASSELRPFNSIVHSSSVSGIWNMATISYMEHYQTLSYINITCNDQWNMYSRKHLWIHQIHRNKSHNSMNFFE